MQLSQSIYCLQINNKNTYMIIDDKIVIIDAINDIQWFQQLDDLLDNRMPDYFIMSHEYQMSVILSLCQKYPYMQLLGTTDQLHHFHHINNSVYCIKDMMFLDHHTLYFLSVHNYIITYILEDKILLSSRLFSSHDYYLSWIDNARYDYAKNLGNSKTFVSNIIKTYDIRMICPSYGQIIRHDINQYIRYLELWEQRIPEEDGVFIITDSLNEKLYQTSCCLQNALIKFGDNAYLYDCKHADLIFLVSQIFKYDRLIISVDMDHVEELLDQLQYMHIRNRVVGFVCLNDDQYFILKYRLSFLENILYVDPMIIDRQNISINQYAKIMMEVGCVDGVCV